jgi:hypothetical protein
MKIILNPRQTVRGSTLLVTALLAIIAGSTLTYILVSAQQEFSSVNRSRAWNSALILAEAGIEEGMTLINNGSWSSASASAADGWTVNNNVYSITRVMDGKLGSYTVIVTNSSPVPTIRSTGTAYTQDSNNHSNNVTRTVLVRTVNTSPFPGALTMQQTIDMNGNNVTVDSYDSTDSRYSIWLAALNYGIYVNTGSSRNNYRKAGGDVATDGGVTGVIDVGNGQIYGKVNTGPGGTAVLGSQGSVGDLNWVPTKGIKPGYSQNDMNVAFPPVTVPTTNWTSLANNNNITSSGAYKMNEITGNMTISGSNVVLYVPSGISLKGNSVLTIQTNARVTIYAGGSITDGGNGKINSASQHATQLIIFGLPSLTSIKLNGNGAFWGAIYAPSARVQFKGGGNSGGFYGALVGYDIVMTGNSTFSYDEALGKFGGSGFTVTSWKEIGY